jgi:hypothetical protein
MCDMIFAEGDIKMTLLLPSTVFSRFHLFFVQMLTFAFKPSANLCPHSAQSCQLWSNQNVPAGCPENWVI